MDTLYLLDTNILVHFVRADSLWQRIRADYSLMMIEPTPVISIITDGELRSLSLQFDWAADKLSQMNFALNFFRRLTLDDPDLLDAYAMIDNDTRRIGNPMGKSDVWIAATGNVFGAKLLTTDRDFDAIAPKFVERIWIDPDIF